MLKAIAAIAAVDVVMAATAASSHVSAVVEPLDISRHEVAQSTDGTILRRFVFADGRARGGIANNLGNDLFRDIGHSCCKPLLCNLL